MVELRIIQAVLRKKCIASSLCVLQEKNHALATKTPSGLLFLKNKCLCVLNCKITAETQGYLCKQPSGHLFLRNKSQSDPNN